MVDNSLSLRFHGGSDEVTGSRHLIQLGAARVMLDCGWFQGHRGEAIRKNDTFPQRPDAVDAVLVSHAHIDHSGGLPLLVKRGYRKSIHCTRVTADLLKIMLMDSAFLQEEDARFFNKIHAAEGISIEPLYDTEDVERTLGLLQPHDYGADFDVVPNLRAKFINAGHVLGSAQVHLEARTTKGVRHLHFTGDLGRAKPLLLHPPENPGHVDYLLTESTYGGRRHPPLTEGQAAIRDVILKSQETGGKILIPSFALERTQEILFILEALRRRNEIPAMHVYVDSPMAVSITEVFARTLGGASPSTLFDASVLSQTDPFGLHNVRYVRTVDESKALNNIPGRKIIIAASGMCEGGRILHHLRNSIDDPRTTILLVGYQAGGTLGRRLVDGQKKVKIFGLPHEVRAEIRNAEAFSAHADQEDLVSFIRNLQPRPQSIFLVHGDPDERLALKTRLAAEGIDRVVLPTFGEEIRLD